ncbi:hypothetical protein BpHYR1_018508 [Brachionus plicatilis]|uniref:Uncharacterized protein n=1 Tax=Brachionus plicatilis TaxID=10195 RepID=A0A3M7S5J4_BRAPC|nr:hypothetical protein BpHYR1_018508 [Brachionus plicatilis]
MMYICGENGPIYGYVFDLIKVEVPIELNSIYGYFKRQYNGEFTRTRGRYSKIIRTQPAYSFEFWNVRNNDNNPKTNNFVELAQ